MKTFFATLALLAAPAPAQTFPLHWGDVTMNVLLGTVQPVMVGNELGLLFVTDATTPFIFHNSTTQQLRVHAVAWHMRNWSGSRPDTVKLVGHETTCQQTAWSFPFSSYVYPGFGWQPVSFVLENLTGTICNYPRLTAWQFSRFSAGEPPPLSAWLVTAVGGW